MFYICQGMLLTWAMHCARKDKLSRLPYPFIKFLRYVWRLICLNGSTGLDRGSLAGRLRKSSSWYWCCKTHMEDKSRFLLPGCHWFRVRQSPHTNNPVHHIATVQNLHLDYTQECMTQNHYYSKPPSIALGMAYGIHLQVCKTMNIIQHLIKGKLWWHLTPWNVLQLKCSSDSDTTEIDLKNRTSSNRKL